MNKSDFSKEQIEQINKFEFIELEIDKNYDLKSIAELLIENNVDLDFLNSLVDDNHKNDILKSLGIITKDTKKFDFFHQLSNNQKKEYFHTFSSKNNELKLIKKYSKIRLRRLFKNLLQYSKNSLSYKSEIELLKSFGINEFAEYSDELLNTLTYLNDIQEEEVIDKFKLLKFIDSLLGDSKMSLILTLDSKKYELISKQIIEPSTFNRLKNYSSLILRKALEHSETIFFHEVFINEILFQKRIIKFNIDDNFDENLKKMRVHVLKEAPIITELLEPFCRNFSSYILSSRIKGRSHVNNFLFEYHRLARAYYTIKQFEKALFWIEDCYDIIEKLENKQNVDFINNELELKKLEDLKSLCLKKQEKLRQIEEKKAKSLFSPTFKSFEDARTFVRALNLKSESQWRIYRKSGNKPIDIPSAPRQVYKNKGWTNWRDWLGNEALVIYRKYDDAKKFVHSLRLESSTYWRTYCGSGNKPKDIPSSPYVVYKNKGWVNWGDWLGTGVNKFNLNPTFLMFEEARLFVRNKGLKSVIEWREYNKTGRKPINIPSHPDRVYKNKGWVSWGDWLGTRVKSTNLNAFLSFKEARDYVSSLGLRSEPQWREYKKAGRKPIDIPSHPDRVYKNKGWTNWRDWFGTN